MCVCVFRGAFFCTRHKNTIPEMIYCFSKNGNSIWREIKHIIYNIIICKRRFYRRAIQTHINRIWGILIWDFQCRLLRFFFSVKRATARCTYLYIITYIVVYSNRSCVALNVSIYFVPFVFLNIFFFFNFIITLAINNLPWWFFLINNIIFHIFIFFITLRKKPNKVARTSNPCIMSTPGNTVSYW